MRGFLDVIVAQVGDPRTRRIALDVLVETTRMPELATARHDVVAEPRRTAAAAVLSRAIDRGELPTGLDRELGLDLLISPLPMRLLFATGPVDDACLARLTTVIVAGLDGV